MLQQMRGLAKYIWVLVAIVFVGGFLLYETSGLIGKSPVTATTAVAVVNGTEIPYTVYMQRVQAEIQNQQQQARGRTLSQDDTRRIESNVFDQMVSDILLQNEYRKRGIVVTDDEVREFARYAPPPWIMQAPELMTDGRFDPEKYQRLLGSAQARQSGLLVSLEQYYRSEIPKQKLFDQVSSGMYVSDAELWRAWRDQHDSAQVELRGVHAAAGRQRRRQGISDADLRAYFDKHKSEFQGTGTASLSVVIIPKTVTAADTAAARAKAAALREEIVKGAKFEDVAKRESADTVSGANGGDLGKGGRNRFVAEFEKAAYALKPGELSQPVLSPFGFHIIRVDSKKGDTLACATSWCASRRATPSRRASTSRRTRCRAAPRRASRARSSTARRKQLKLPVYHVQAVEDEPAMLGGRVDSQRQRVGVRRRARRRDERAVRRRQRLLPRAPRHAAAPAASRSSRT